MKHYQALRVELKKLQPKALQSLTSKNQIERPTDLNESFKNCKYFIFRFFAITCLPEKYPVNHKNIMSLSATAVNKKKQGKFNNHI